MNGNACKKVLLKLDSLRRHVPRRLSKFVSALEEFETVRNSCFGQELHPDYKLNIIRFSKAYDQLGVPRTNKVHILVDHVPDFCDSKGKGLGFYSEQASEAVHCDYKKTWKNHKVHETNPKFPSNLLAATLKYNCKHL